LPKALHPHYQEVLHTLVPADFKTVPFHTATGQMDEDSLAQALDDKTAALVLPLPNFFGVIEDVHRLTNLAHARGALLVALVNPLSLAFYATWPWAKRCRHCRGRRAAFGFAFVGWWSIHWLYGDKNGPRAPNARAHCWPHQRHGR